MHAYEYRGFDRAGRPVRGVIDALSLKDARERLVGTGVLPERVQRAGGRRRVTTEWRSNLYRELGALLGAGLTLEGALNQMCAAPELQAERGLLAAFRSLVREGGTVAGALAGGGLALGDFERAALDAAERAGTLDAVLRTLAEFLDDRERILARVRSALVYPAIIVAVGLCVAILMLGLLLPWAQRIIAQSGSELELPGLTRFLLAVGDAVLGWAGLALLAAAAAAALWARQALRDPEWRGRFARASLRVPLLGRGAGLLANLRFARTMALLLRGGVTPIEAMRMAGRATGNAWLAAATERQADAVQQGERLSDALARVPVLGERLPGWIRVGEAGGGLADLLDGAGGRYREQWDRFVTRALAILEPALILVIGAFVLLITLSVLLPILSLSRGVAL